MTENSAPPVSYEQAQELLTAAGAPFELVEEEAHGERIQVFKTRAPSPRIGAPASGPGPPGHLYLTESLLIGPREKAA